MDFLVTSLASIQQGSFRIASQTFTIGGQEMKSGIEKTLIDENLKIQAKPTRRLDVTTTTGSRTSTTSGARASVTLAESPVISPGNAPRRKLLHAPMHQK
jgi:outer membrane translocation and assembly module TamA